MQEPKKCFGCGRTPTRVARVCIEDPLYTYCRYCDFIIQPYDEIAEAHAFCPHCDALFHIRELFKEAHGDAACCPECGEEL